MTAPRRLTRLTALGIGLITLALTGCGEDTPAPTPTATINAPTPTSTPPTTDGGTEGMTDAEFRIGQPADGGSFEPLVIPDHLPYGTETTLTDEQLTDNGMPTPGQVGVIYTPNPSTTSDYKPTFLFTIDTISEPLTGPDYQAIYDTFGLGNGLAAHGAPIQKLTYRIREIATAGGNVTTFDILSVMQGLTFAGEASKFLVSETPLLDCAGDRNPFLEHGWATADTVQGCGFVITPASAAQTESWFYGLQARGKLADGTTDQFTVFQTDKFPDDGGAGHDDLREEE